MKNTLRHKNALSCLFFILLLLLCGGARVQGSEGRRFIVKIKQGVDLQSIMSAPGLLGAPGLTVRRSRLLEKLPALKRSLSRSAQDARSSSPNPMERVLIISAQDSLTTASDIKRLFQNAQIEYVEEDILMQLFDVPVDPHFVNQWHLLNDAQTYLGLERIEGPENDSIRPISGVAGEDVALRRHYQAPYTIRKRPLIGLIDTGVDDLHPELAGQIWVNPDEYPNDRIDNDHNGLIDDVRGYDFSGNYLEIFEDISDNEPTDQIGHGSHIAGIIAALPDGNGVVGICPQAQILPIKVFPNAFASISAEAVIYAVNSGVDILSISWGSPFRSHLIDEAFAYAIANGVFVAVASGNTGDNSRFQPADIAELFTVGASNSSGKVTFFSTYGSHIDIVAPGRDILSIRGGGTDMFAPLGEPEVHIIDNSYYLADGTSMAAPMVAAGAAFLLSVRPEMTNVEIQNALRNGARDIIEPYDTGASFPGPDSLSGAGNLDIARALDLVSGAALTFMEPNNYSRMTESFALKSRPLEDYDGLWTLEYGRGTFPEVYMELTAGAAPPFDSVLFIYSDTLLSGLVTFRLTDNSGRRSLLRVYVSSSAAAYLLSPANGETVRNPVEIKGAAHAPNYDSLIISVRDLAGVKLDIHHSTSEFYDQSIFDWQLDVEPSGEYELILRMFHGTDTISDSTLVNLKSTLHPGWPAALGDFQSVSAVASDLTGDGNKEIMIGTRSGMIVLNSDAERLPGFPSTPQRDCRSVPTVADIDGDGALDIIYTSDQALHVVNLAGEEIAGFPKYTSTGQAFLGFPTPTILKLALEEDSAIVFVNASGQIHAYRFNGDSYFFSLNGLFTRIDPNITNDFLFRGLSIPHIANFDRNVDGRNELICSYSSPGATSGLFVFNGRDGQAANELISARALSVRESHGAAYADVDGDGYLDALLSGTDQDNNTMLWLRKSGEVEFPGWPIEIPEAFDWIGGYPIFADLNGDDTPEIIAVFSEFDISRLYVFNLDGSPFYETPGRYFGEIVTVHSVLGGLVVVDVNGDGQPEIITRSGFLLPGAGFEKVYAFTPQGEIVPGFPLTTSAKPFTVFSTAYVPLIDDIDNDGLLEIVLSGADLKVTVWDMIGPISPRKWDWPRFLHGISNDAIGGKVTGEISP